MGIIGKLSACDAGYFQLNRERERQLNTSMHGNWQISLAGYAKIKDVS
jgi:hypothetical protein